MPNMELKNVTKKWEKFILEDINFLISESDVIAFIGENGSGKTSVIKSIFNEIKLDSGEILLNGENINSNRNLTKIAFFPDSNNIPLDLTTNEYVEYISQLANISKQTYKERVKKIFDILKIDEKFNKKISKLSAGMKKKVILAGVLISEPKFIFFDEPTANLDIDSKAELIEIIEFLSTLKIGILVTSHISDELQQIANRVIVIQNGKIIHDQKFNKLSDNILDIYKTYYKNDGVSISKLGDIYE